MADRGFVSREDAKKKVKQTFLLSLKDRGRELCSSEGRGVCEVKSAITEISHNSFQTH